jgi:dienelactone hydrolase
MSALLWSTTGLSAALYEVAVESSSRKTITGQTVVYQLYLPKPSSSSGTKQQFPAVILTHGFGRDPSNHAVNARYMAERGIAVMTPKMTSLFGRRGQDQNIANTVDHVVWLIQRSLTPGDALFGLVDPRRIALAGHSAGGAVSVEAAVEARNKAVPISAILLLDGVPWDRTIESAARLAWMPVGSLRAEPSPCNARGSVLDLQRNLAFATADVLLLGATHCDPENPTSAMCRLMCKGGSAERQSLYQRLMYLFLRDTFEIHDAGEESGTYLQALSELESAGAVKVTLIAPDSGNRVR